jgi:hypothetical protein
VPLRILRNRAQLIEARLASGRIALLEPLFI